MKLIRFSGLVRLANEVQRELSGTITTSRREQLRAHVQQAVRLVEQTLIVRGAKFGAVPGPTRRAFQFLQNLDLDRVPTTVVPSDVQPPQRVALRGITATVEHLSESLARQIDERRPNLVVVQQVISRLMSDVEGSTSPEESLQLTTRSSEHLAWLRYFADADRLIRYMEAVGRACPVFRAIAAPDRWPGPIRLHFRPTQSIYRVRGMADFTRVLLPTPMITLDEAEFELLGRAMFGRRRRGRDAALHELLLSHKYQTLQNELRRLGGDIEQTRGMVHDLEESFRRVNETLFAGQMPRPWLRWNHCITAGKFGHYNYATDTVMVSRTLDQPEVPAFVVDHVMHHELLHKRHGLRWARGRGHAHTAEFRREERLFPLYEAADQYLQKLASGGCPCPRT